MMDMILLCRTQCFTYIYWWMAFFFRTPDLLGWVAMRCTIAVGKDVVRTFSQDNSVSYYADMGQFHREWSCQGVQLTTRSPCSPRRMRGPLLWPRLGSGRSAPASHCGSPCDPDYFLWDLWWVHWHWHRYFLRVPQFSAVTLIQAMLQLAVFFPVSLTSRTYGRSLRTLQQKWCSLENRGASGKKVFLCMELYCQICPPSWLKSRVAVRFTFTM
jgi:hypothetical protein